MAAYRIDAEGNRHLLAMTNQHRDCESRCNRDVAIPGLHQPRLLRHYRVSQRQVGAEIVEPVPSRTQGSSPLAATEGKVPPFRVARRKAKAGHYIYTLSQGRALSPPIAPAHEARINLATTISGNGPIHQIKRRRGGACPRPRRG